jgi:TonB-linked SusC/RagA family outer membrane protein
MLNKLRIKVSIVLISGLAFLLSFSAQGQETTLKDSELQTINLKEVVRYLEKEYTISITMDGNLGNNQISIPFVKIKESATIDSALDILVKNTDLDYVKMRNDYYVIGKKTKTDKSVLKEKTKENATKTIKGRVYFKNDKSSIPGAAVVIKGTNKGVATDLDGNFEIEVSPDDKVLQISYIGMKSVELDISSTVNFNVELTEDAFGLDEVVVSGVAAETPRKNLTISVSKVNGDVLKEASSSSAASSLQGKVAGVTVVQANGLPGGGASIRLRGSTSLTGANAPLVIMDGNILSTNLADINIDDIESMEVVKGAAASALYGSRAGNGVIVITTKRGSRNKAGSTTVNIRQELGSQEIPKFIKQATHHPYQLASDWANYDYTRYAGVNYDDQGNIISGSRILTESGYADQSYAKLYENQKEFYKTGVYNSTYVSVMGNSNKTNFSLSYEYNKQEGVLFATDGYQRNNFRINLDHHITDKLKVSTSNLIVLTNSNSPGATRTFSDLLFVAPDVDLKSPNADGTLYNIIPDPWSVAENPLYPLANRQKLNKRRSLIGNFAANYSATDWLSLNAKYTYEYRNQYWSTLTSKGYLGFGGQSNGGTLYKRSYDNFNQNLQFTLNLNRQFGDFTGKIKMSYLYENRHWNNFQVLGADFLFSGVPQLDNTDPTRSTLSSYNGDEIAINYFAILDMDYKDKYLLSALYRYDASSLFGENVRWNPYYRFSLGYRLTEDISIPGIQELKIRASTGTSGQRPGYSWQYETWDINNGVAVPSTIGNKNLRPSETTETELGLDMNFLNHFSFVFTYSQSITRGAFALAPMASHLGFPYQYKNVGQLSSKVLEASLQMKLAISPQFGWTSNLNFDRVRQKVDKLDVPDYTTGPRNTFYIKENGTFGIMYGYTWVKSLDDMANQLPTGATIDQYEINNEGYVVLAGTQGTVGEIPIKLDANNDGLGDKVQIGDGNPEFQLNWGNTFSYKGFSLYMLWSWKNGGDIYNYTRQYTFRDQRDIVFDQTNVPDNQKKTINYYNAFYDGTGINSYFIEDGSYLKLRELSLYYSLKKKNMPSFLVGVIKSLRVGIQARNVLTFTNYKGYDPEVATGSDLTNFPFDNFGYPNYRTYTGSISINF